MNQSNSHLLWNGKIKWKFDNYFRFYTILIWKGKSVERSRSKKKLLGCLCVIELIWNTTQNDFLLVHISVFHLFEQYLYFDKKNSQHTHNVIREYTMKRMIFVNKHSYKHTHKRQFTQNDETYSWVAAFTNFSRLIKFHICFQCLSNNRDFYTLFFIRKRKGGNRYFLGFESDFIDSVFSNLIVRWVNEKKLYWASINVVFSINLPDVRHVCGICMVHWRWRWQQ